jgi:hypothetical protein
LSSGIGAGLTVTVQTIAEIASASVLYSPKTRQFKFEFMMAAGFENAEVEIMCHAIKNEALTTGMSPEGGFSDVHEILGARPIRSFDAMPKSLDGTLTAGKWVFLSPYPAALNTLDALYLHLDIGTGNFMSTGFESYAADSLRMVESSLFARIPFSDSSFSEKHEVVTFEDSGGDMYQSMIHRHSIESLDIRVTDARGRSLSMHCPEQSKDGMLGFRLVLRWDLWFAPPGHNQIHKLEHHPPRM